MTKEELKIKIDLIIKGGGDPEVAHIEEDQLHIELIQEFCPEWVKEEVERLNKADFPRWCA